MNMKVGTFDLILDTKQDLLNDDNLVMLRFFYCLTSKINAYIKFFEGDNLYKDGKILFHRKTRNR
mgnify:CR=1 FL=1